MRVINVVVVDLSPDDAARMLKEYPYSRQRVLKLDRVNYYRHLLETGKFQPGMDIEVGYAPDENGVKSGYLLNGQHRLTAVAESGIGAQFTLRHFECVDLEELAHRYGATDTQAVRTLRDQARALDLPGKYDLIPSEVHTLLAAVPFMHNGFLPSRRLIHGPEERVAMCEEYVEAFKRMRPCLEAGDARIMGQMRRMGPMAVALATFHDAYAHYGEKITMFWRGIAQDDGLKVGDPRKVAIRALLDAQGVVNNKGARISQAYTARAIANCWNAWAEAREIASTRVPDPTGPILLVGTRYNKLSPAKVSSNGKA